MNSTKYCTYLYFHSSSGFPDQILIASLAHYSYFSERYILITNIARHLFPRGLQDRIQILSINECESQQTRLICSGLVQFWSSGVLKANCPAIELHCFKRWLILCDLFDAGLIQAHELVFAHDWDDLIYLPIKTVTDVLDSKLAESRFQPTLRPLICSHTALPIGMHLGPHFLVINSSSVEEFRNSVLRLSRVHSRYHSKENFPDMCIWAYLFYQNILPGKGIALLWDDLLRGEFFLDSNIRVLNPSGIPMASRSVLIPPRYNYLDNKQTHLSIKLYDCKGPGSSLQVHYLDGRIAKGVNIHYSGVEGKYILMHDLRSYFRDFYNARPELQNLIDIQSP